MSRCCSSPSFGNRAGRCSVERRPVSRFGEGKAKYSTVKSQKHSQGEWSTVIQTSAIYSPMDPKNMFAELLAEADRMSQIPKERADQCFGADRYDMMSFFAGQAQAYRTVVERYQTSVAAVDLTSDVRDKLKDAVLGRAFYNPAMGRILTAVESILILAGAGTPQNKEAAKELIRGAITAIQESMRAEWDTQWWELIKPQVQDIQTMALVEGVTLENLVRDRATVFYQVHDRVHNRMLEAGDGLPTSTEQFIRVVTLAVIEGLEACGLVEEKPPEGDGHGSLSSAPWIAGAKEMVQHLTDAVRTTNLRTR